MTLRIDTNRGEAIIGPVRVEVCAIGDENHLRIGGEDGPVLRQITFGERTAAYLNCRHAAKYADFLSAIIAHTATVSPGIGERDIIEIIALHLAGAENDAPTFVETANKVSKATGWSAELIDSRPAVYIDSLFMQISGITNPWRTILLAPSTEEPLLSIKHHLAMSILKRGNGSSELNEPDKDIEENNAEETEKIDYEASSDYFEQSTLLMPKNIRPEIDPSKNTSVRNKQKTPSKLLNKKLPDHKEESSAVPELFEKETLLLNLAKPEGDLLKSNQHKKPAEPAKQKVYEKEIFEFSSKTNRINQKADNVENKESDLLCSIPSAHTLSSSVFYGYAENNSIIDKENFSQNSQFQKAETLIQNKSGSIIETSEIKVKSPDVVNAESENKDSKSVNAVQSYALYDKQDESIKTDRDEKNKYKAVLKPDEATPSIKPTRVFPFLAISLEKERAPVISSMKTIMKPNQTGFGQTNNEKTASLKRKEFFANKDYHQISGANFFEPVMQKKSDFVWEKSNNRSDVFASSSGLTKDGEKNLDPINVMAEKPLLPENTRFLYRQADVKMPESDLPMTKALYKNSNSYLNPADQIASLLHQEADMRGIDR
ncbi:MAG: hypothetical protein KKC46_14065 [Proteobacteria bacterium]|nr:hypothetical protein [Pseudomonadota bacterium]